MVRKQPLVVDQQRKSYSGGAEVDWAVAVQESPRRVSLPAFEPSLRRFVTELREEAVVVVIVVVSSRGDSTRRRPIPHPEVADYYSRSRFTIDLTISSFC